MAETLASLAPKMKAAEMAVIDAARALLAWESRNEGHLGLLRETVAQVVLIEDQVSGILVAQESTDG